MTRDRTLNHIFSLISHTKRDDYSRKRKKNIKSNLVDLKSVELQSEKVRKFITGMKKKKKLRGEMAHQIPIQVFFI
jgi:hypothetical protein